MDDAELLGLVRNLRADGLAPKQIARSLGVGPARVAPLIRMIAEQDAATAPEPSVVGCWVSGGWSGGLGVDDSDGWPDIAGDSELSSGLVGVVVARERSRHRGIAVCGYLVDTYCLGVKNAMGPLFMDSNQLRTYVTRFFEPFEGGSIEAPIELAQYLVWGALAYARDLGFEPHHDFASTADHLGVANGTNPIRFGCDGVPLYVAGPYDNAGEIMRKLKGKIATGDAHFLVQAPGAFADE